MPLRRPSLRKIALVAGLLRQHRVVIDTAVTKYAKHLRVYRQSVLLAR